MTRHYYVTVPFSLSPTSWAWLMEHAQPLMDQFFNNNNGYMGPVPIANVVDWESSEAFKEVAAFSKQFGLRVPEVSFFMYPERVRQAPARGNPHIDTRRAPNSEDSTSLDVTIRFNLLLVGTEDQEMVWWDADRNHPACEIIEYELYGKEAVKRLQVRGDSIEEKWNNLPEPACKASNLTEINKTSSFVRTDLVHCINRKGYDRRVILTFRWTSPWSEFEEQARKLGYIQ